VVRFIELLQLITPSKNYALTVLHTSQIAIMLTRSSQFLTVFANLVKASTVNIPISLAS
jgi:hypothetical protein